jgi:hypothetical protein
MKYLRNELAHFKQWILSIVRVRFSLSKIRIGNLIISVGWHRNNEDDIIRKEAKDWMVKKSLNNKECEFTGMTLHYTSLPKVKGRSAWGEMLIHLD